MKSLLKLEELVQFLACLFTLIVINVAWWVYPLLLVGPDISMLGYLKDPRTGALFYNLFHHKALAIVVGLLIPYLGHEFGFDDSWVYQNRHVFIISGLILYGHASMDRALGYGLKFGDHFKHTHLGWIGGKNGE